MRRFVEKPSESLLCLICKCIAESPVFCSNSSNHLFCYECITTWIQYNPVCPLDQRPLKAEDMTVQSFVKTLIEGLTIRCRCVESGCNVKLTVEAEPSHAALCQYKPMSLQDKVIMMQNDLDQQKRSMESIQRENVHLKQSLDSLVQTFKDHLIGCAGSHAQLRSLNENTSSQAHHLSQRVGFLENKFVHEQSRSFLLPTPSPSPPISSQSEQDVVARGFPSLSESSVTFGSYASVAASPPRDTPPMPSASPANHDAKAYDRLLTYEDFGCKPKVSPTHLEAIVKYEKLELIESNLARQILDAIDFHKFGNKMSYE